MKKIILIAVFILLISGIAGANPPSPPLEKGGSNEPFPGWNKLDGGAKAAWSKGKSGDQFELILRTTVPVKKKQKKQFDLVGFKYRSIVGSFVTGSIDVKLLQCLAGLEFVDVIEGGVPVSNKKNQRTLKGAIPRKKP